MNETQMNPLRLGAMVCGVFLLLFFARGGEGVALKAADEMGKQLGLNARGYGVSVCDKVYVENGVFCLESNGFCVCGVEK